MPYAKILVFLLNLLLLATPTVVIAKTVAPPPPEVERLLKEAEEAFDGVGGHKRGFPLLEQAAHSGHPEAMYRLGEYLLTRDEKKSIIWLEKSAKAGHPEAMYRLAWFKCGAGNTPPDLPQCFYWHEEAAKQNESRSMRALGKLYSKDKRVETDLTKACFWYKKGAEAGDFESMYENGMCYLKGLTGQKDNEKAFDWFKRSARQDERSAYELGQCYANGRGVEKDMMLAVLWHTVAFEATGHRESTLLLGTYYTNGIGVAKDEKRGCYYFNHAVGLEAEYQKGLCALKGLGRDINPQQEAVNRFWRAAEGGHAQAIEQLMAQASSGNKEAVRYLGNLIRKDPDQKIIALLYTLAMDSNTLPQETKSEATDLLCNAYEQHGGTNLVKVILALARSMRTDDGYCISSAIHSLAQKNNPEAKAIWERWQLERRR